MASRRANHLNFLTHRSDDRFLIHDRTDNANVTGVNFGFWKLEYDSARDEFRVRLYANRNDAEDAYLAQSDVTDAATLPATVTVNEANDSGVSGTIYIDGVR